MTRLLSTSAALVLMAGAAQAEPIRFEYWYGLGGYLGEQVAATCERFNAAQDEFEIVCVGQGSYEQAVQNTIAAFRANQHPTLVQSFDAGTTDLILSGEFYPVYQMMQDFGIDIDWDDYFPGIKNYYATSDGRVISMPFNSSTPLMYYNIDMLAQGGIEAAPETWEDFEASLVAMKDAGVDIPFCYAPSTWIDLEQFSMVHNVPIATNSNGYDGLDAELTFNQTVHVRHMENIVRWVNEGLAAVRTAEGGMNARDSFGAGLCGYFFGSVASHQTVHNIAADGLNWHVAKLPRYSDFERTNTVVGGASLWVLNGKSDDEYRAAAAYLQFLATPEQERIWVERTGYIPVTLTAYEQLLESGFYDNDPFRGREIAMDSLTYTEPTNLTRGIRLGSFIQIRQEWVSEMQAALGGTKTVQQALDDAVTSGNALLRRFERTYRGRELP